MPAGAEKYFFIKGKESNEAYSTSKKEIGILLKTGKVKPMSKITDHAVQTGLFVKHYLCYPKEIEK